MLNLDFEHSLTQIIHHRQIPLILSVIIACLILINLFSFLSIFRSSREIHTHVQQLSYQKQNGQQIAQQHLFGVFQEKTLPQTAPVTPLNLSLAAVFYSENNSQKSGALISQMNGSAGFYYEGDSLPNGAKVKQIFPDKVIIDNGGSTQTLELPIPKLEFAPPPQDGLPK